MIVVPLEIKNNLNRVSENHPNNSILFTFQFQALNIRCVYFAKSSTMLIGLSDFNTAWQIDLSSDVISERIPNEVYRVIKNVLKEGNGYSNRPFFDALVNSLQRLAHVQSINSAEIIELLRFTKTTDRKYDKEGELPFFDHWRRVRPSAESLFKIQKYFGSTVREECFQNKVTGVWSASPTSGSLAFLNPEATIYTIKGA